MVTQTNTPAPAPALEPTNQPLNVNALAQYIQNTTFRRLINGDQIVDTRPYVGNLTKPPKAPLTGLRFTGYGMAPIYGKPEAPKIENLGYLPVTHIVAGNETPVAGKDWQAMLSALPPGTTVFVDEWKDSKQSIGSVTFMKRADGSWSRAGADQVH